jgi:hypothetical protein
VGRLAAEQQPRQGKAGHTAHAIMAATLLASSPEQQHIRMGMSTGLGVELTAAAPLLPPIYTHTRHMSHSHTRVTLTHTHTHTRVTLPHTHTHTHTHTHKHVTQTQPHRQRYLDAACMCAPPQTAGTGPQGARGWRSPPQ